MSPRPLAPALRAAFPHAGAHESAPYCVGASLGHYVGAVDDPFPDETELACHFEEIRGSPERAGRGEPRKVYLRWATAIIEANDVGNSNASPAGDRRASRASRPLAVHPGSLRSPGAPSGDTDDAWALLARSLRGIVVKPRRLACARRVAARREREFRPPTRERILNTLLSSPPGRPWTLDIPPIAHHIPACPTPREPSST